MIQRSWLGPSHPVGTAPDKLRHLLLDPDFWRPRLDTLNRTPRHLVLFPRPDLSRPGVEVIELRLRAFDGKRLHALLCRSAFGQHGDTVHVRCTDEVASGELDLEQVCRGGTDLIFSFPSDRRLEERVMDVLRVTQAACSIEAVDCGKITFVDASTGEGADEFVLADLIRTQGWFQLA